VKISKGAVAALSALGLAAVTVTALPAAGVTVATAAIAATAGTAGAPGPSFRHACAAASAGWGRCGALVDTSVVTFEGMAPDASVAGYSPAQLQSAYNLTLAAGAAGKGETVAVIDAYNDPDAAANLKTYRAHYGLAACGSGCLRKVNEEGEASPLPKSAGKTGWGTEESLDLDMVSAICPNCHILLVEAKNGSMANLGKAVDAAVALGAKFVSNSYSSPETASETADDAYFDHPGVAVTAAGGDSGYGVGYPAASQYVTSVGGTSLSVAKGTARGWKETVWDNGYGATGSGCSSYEAKPSWQKDSGCTHRTDNDVAADANPGTGAAVYDSYDQGGWIEVGGTSEAAAIIAATYALAGTAASGAYPAEFLYQHPGDLNDITAGSDGSCSVSYLCTARAGYDGPTGLGTPDGTGAFQAVDHTVVVVKPASKHSKQGVRITPVRIEAHDSHHGATLTFRAVGLPPGLKISKGGVIYGKPHAAGSYRVKVYATDATGITGSAKLRWTVRS
jgi:Putative Ig domain